ncbi:hypothetical protein BIWAKO_02922 [Bosea sp. BIWAKO-01]|nr:hypothetical protein BIWAKO_02922 [Bosea sp. BIWAKO-01]
MGGADGTALQMTAPLAANAVRREMQGGDGDPVAIPGRQRVRLRADIGQSVLPHPRRGYAAAE